ncbi:universal stress protein [Desulfosediminicola flagellatus]|uniref:universal stress protein n=1 Tax=Desulfosediminicola flagellatus TaxID=2569541 RepID=UPI0010AC3E7C|nr:universal stress protein [Desulfosediminicola flagellatus]
MITHTVKTILAAMNTSHENRSLYKEALALASSMRARVVVVSVTPDYEGNMNRFFLNDAEQQFKAPFQEILREADEYATSLGLSMETVHRIGKPDEEICAVAYEVNADIILLGCVKRMQVERMLLGRTTVEVITNSPCDVLIIPEDGELRFDKILAGLNGSAASIEAGLRAIDIAKSYGSEIHALYATNIPTDLSLRHSIVRDAEQKGWKILKEFVLQGKEHDVSVITAIRANIPEDCLAAYAQEKHIHLIILGARKESLGLDMFCGSVVERIAALTPCPVLVAKNR